MKILMRVMLVAITLCSLSCQKESSRVTEASLIKPNSAKAQLLALTSDDISVLSQQHPELIRKIHKREMVSIADIIAMQEVSLSPDSMILIIEYTKSLFTLSTSDVIRLQAEGVPFKVINYMIRT